MPLTQVWTVVSLPVGLRLDGGFVSLPAGLGVPKRHLEGLERFRPGKRQA